MQVSERMVLAQKAYILFYIRKQPENGHAGPAAPAAQQRPSTAPPVQRTASLAQEDPLKPDLTSAGEIVMPLLRILPIDALQGDLAQRQCTLSSGGVDQGVKRLQFLLSERASALVWGHVTSASILLCSNSLQPCMRAPTLP